MFKSRYVRRSKSTTPIESSVKSPRKLKGTGSLPNEAMQIIIGILLGDASAESRSPGTARITHSQEIPKNAAYAIWLHEYLSKLGLCNPILVEKTRTSATGRVRRYYKFNTYTFKEFFELRQRFYQNGIKIIDFELLELYLTPLALAVWISDDGGSSGSGVKIATNCFSKEETTKLCAMLNRKFGLVCNPNGSGEPTGKQWHIYIWKESVPLLQNLIGDLLVPSMWYKINKTS